MLGSKRHWVCSCTKPFSYFSGPLLQRALSAEKFTLREQNTDLGPHPPGALGCRLLLGFSPAQRSGHSIFFFRTQLNRVSVKLRLKEYLVYGKPCANEGLKKGRWGISTLWKIVTGGCQLSQEGRACRPPGSLGAGLSCAVNLYGFGPPQISEPTADKTTFVTVRDCS